jgi:biofilm PGA synthesis protein PgaA
MKSELFNHCAFCLHLTYRLSGNGLACLLSLHLMLASYPIFARTEVSQVKKSSAQDIAALHRKAAQYHAAKDDVNAAATYQQILALDPDDKTAIRGRAFATLEMGAPNLALHYAKQNRSHFTDAEWLNFQQASAGRLVRWGTLEAKAGLGQQRFKATDMALQHNLALREQHQLMQQNQLASNRYTEFDRMVALRDREQMQEVINVYLQLKQQTIDIPAYALVAIADAYLYLRQPKQARDLYLQALTASKQDADYPNREWQLNLFNAYIDGNEFNKAIDLIDAMVIETPPIIHKGLKGVELDNEFYEQARVSQALARIYAQRPKEAQTLLSNTLKTAPHLIDARLAHAELLQVREQPRAAQKEYVSILVDEPSSNAAANGIAETAITIHDIKTAQFQLNQLLAHYPENLETQRINHLMQSQISPTLVMRSGFSKSPNGAGNRGNQDWNIDALLYSALLNDNWRVFSHSFNAEADFDGAENTRKRIGMGADYRSPSYLFSLELNQDQSQFANYGLVVDASWLPSDYWRVNVGLDSNSNDIPLQASANQTKMRTIKLSLNYLSDESRSVNAAVSQAWLTDGNRRTEANTNWQERWASGPIYKLDTDINLSTSKSSLENAAYFNPSRDYSADMQMMNEWTVWRHYQMSFKHTLTLGVGRYWQSGFESGVTQLVRYEQEWILDATRSIQYGIAHEKHPFDGEAAKTTSAFLNVSWNF